MKKNYFLIAFAASLVFLTSCEKNKVKTDRITFEEIYLGEAGYYNGSDQSGGFYIGNAYFKNTYYPPSGGYDESWFGFSYSNHTDIYTPGYGNQYSAIAGHGANGSSKYAVFYNWNPDTIVFTIPEKVTSISFCNSTYAYYAMLDGDDFSKQFGGGSGDDPDYFTLILDCLDENYRNVGRGELNLADYRFTNNAEDYIANTWTELDLSELGYIKYIVLSFESSDTNLATGFINTPQYVCIDNIFGELQE